MHGEPFFQELERIGLHHIQKLMSVITDMREPFKVSKEMEEEGWVYRQPCTANMCEALKQKFDLADALCKETQIITLHSSAPPAIAMNLDMPILEETIHTKINECDH